MAGVTGRVLLTLSLASNLSAFARLSHGHRIPFLKFSAKPNRVLPGFRPLCTIPTATATATTDTMETIDPDQIKHSILLERLRVRHLKDSTKTPEVKNSSKPVASAENGRENELKRSEKKKKLVDSFEELGLSEEVMGAVREMGIEVPTEIQCIGIPAVLEEKSVVLGSHTGSGKTLAYMLPIVQVLAHLVL